MNIDKQIQLALQYHQSGDLQEAEYIFKKILKKQHNNVDVLYKLGVLYAQVGNYDFAIRYIEKSLRLYPNNANAYYILGKIYQEKGQIEESIHCYKKVIKYDPLFALAYFNLGETLQDEGRLDEAVTFYRRVLELNPNCADACNNIGIILNEKGQYDEAIKCYQKALQLNPNFESPYNNLAIVFKNKGNLDEAIKHYQKALQLNPTHAVIHYGLSMTFLLNGNFQEGLKEYEWRWKTKDFIQYCRNFPKPLWNGSEIKGLTILLQYEQGLGDTIQFIRYAPLIAQKGAKVIVDCQRELVSLIKNAEGIQRVIMQGEELPEFDVYCPLLSLPLIFNATLETIPSKVPYIMVESLLAQKWKDKIQYDNSCIKIGLVWAGKPEHKNDRNRSCPLDVFSPLSELRDVSFYSLQKGEAAKQAENPPRGMKLIDYTEEISDFSDTAALIENLDLVLSVDTSVVHLAGALGKPVWTLLPFAPDWRWMLNRDDSPWYPTIRLFRQPIPGDWNSVIEKVSEEIQKLVSSKA